MVQTSPCNWLCITSTCIFFLLVLLQCFWIVFALRLCFQTSSRIMKPQKFVFMFHLIFIFFETFIFMVRPIWSPSINNFIHSRNILCTIYSYSQGAVYNGNYIPIVFAYTKTHFYGRVLNYSETNRTQHRMLRLLMILGFTMIVTNMINCHVEREVVKGVRICFSWSKNQKLLIIGGIYSIWMFITYYCMYYIFNRCEDGMSTSLVEAVPALKIHLWINAKLVPIMFATSCAVMLVAAILLGCFYFSTSNETSRNFDFRVMHEYVMINTTVVDHFINNLIMGYTLFGWKNPNPSGHSTTTEMITPITQEGINVQPARHLVIAFPGIPPVLVPVNLLTTYNYLHNYIIEEETYTSHLFPIFSHSDLMDYVIHARTLQEDPQVQDRRRVQVAPFRMATRYSFEGILME